MKTEYFLSPSPEYPVSLEAGLREASLINIFMLAFVKAHMF
jgi:hypothetical protein